MGCASSTNDKDVAVPTTAADRDEHRSLDDITAEGADPSERADNPLSPVEGRTSKRRSGPCPKSARPNSQQGRPPSAPSRHATPSSRPATAGTFVPALPDFTFPNELGPAIAPMPAVGASTPTFRGTPIPRTPTASFSHGQRKRSQEALRRRVQRDLQHSDAQLDRMIRDHFGAGSVSVGSSALLTASGHDHHPNSSSEAPHVS